MPGFILSVIAKVLGSSVAACITLCISMFSRLPVMIIETVLSLLSTGLAKIKQRKTNT